MKKHLLLAAMLLTATASVGTFSACSNNEDVPEVKPTPNGGSTVMSVQFSLQVPKQKRASDDGQNTTNPSHNYVGKWMGNDLIESVDVYIFKADAAATGPSQFSLEKQAALGPTEISFEQPQAGNPDLAYIRPTKGFKVDPGQKRVFVVVNPTSETQALLNGVTDFDAFAAKYNDVLKLQTAAGAPAPTKYTEAEATTAAAATNDPFTVADHVARIKGTGADQKDVIVMTGAYGEVNVADGVTEPQTLNTSAPVNRAQLSVQRVAARVLVTADQASYEIKGDDPTTPTVETEADGNAVPLVTITNLTYVVAQGESSFYFDQQKSGNTNYEYKTPNSTYVPVGSATDPGSDYDVPATYDKYDYTGLWRNKTNKFGGRDIVTNATYNASKENVIEYVKNADGLHGEFILANTHAYDAADRGASGYRKGNTAYVLVRGKINPKFVWTGPNQIENNWETSAHKDDDLFLGDDGKFYASAALANDPTTANNAAAVAMKVKKFVGGKVLYFVWVNPDTKSATTWINSPAIRNNIYHIQIKGIANYVYNWNPLVPNPNDPIDPTQPVSPTNPRDPNNPNNPDPQPMVPDPDHPGKHKPDPKEPPTDITPKDPLSLKEAWMSVDVTILPWQVHTFETILGK